MLGAGLGVAHLVDSIVRGQEALRDRESDSRRLRSSGDAVDAVGRLQAENAELRLYLATLISLLISNGIISREEFERVSEVIDGLDGGADGRFDGKIGTDGTVGSGANARQNQALRELTAAFQKKGS